MLRNLATRPLLMAATRAALYRVIDFNEVKTISNVVANDTQHSFFVIDVRTPEEVLDTGIIPGATNVPLDTFENAFGHQTPEAFKEKFKVDRPYGKNKTLVVYCHAGARSTQSAVIAEKLGYPDVLNYTGGMSDWMIQNQK